MKKVLAIILTAALLLSAFGVTAFAAEGEKPELTKGPWDGYWWMTGGARISFENHRVDYVKTVLYREGDENEGGLVVDNEVLPGATYDLASNTLTIKDLKLANVDLYLFYMGDDFKLKVEGECELEYISVRNYIGYHSSSLNITGTGTLTVNAGKTSSDAIYFYGDGESMMHLDIADSVTVHLYAKDNATETQPQHVTTIWSTSIEPGDGGAITVGGKTMPEAKGERRTYYEDVTVPGIIAESDGHEYSSGNLVRSKSDPEGTYAARSTTFYSNGEKQEGYYVAKYTYYPELDMYLEDPNFSTDYFSGKNMTTEEFEKEFTFILEPQPKKIQYTTEYREANRGYTGVKMMRTDDPGTVYIGCDEDWHSTRLDEDIDTYDIYKAHWDEDEQFYVVEDDSVQTVDADELENAGFTIVTSEVERHVSMKCWIKGAPYDSDNGNSLESYDLVERESDPEGLYAFMYAYSSGGVMSGVHISPVDYDEENDEYYLRGYYGGVVGEDIFDIDYSEWESGNSEFSYKTETVEQRVEIKYITEYYGYENYSSEAVLVKKDGEPDKLYAYDNWYRESVTPENLRHDLFQVEYNEDNGHYYFVGSYILEEFQDLSEMESQGYHVVTEDQQVSYMKKSGVGYSTAYSVYADSEGNRYFSDWNDNFYLVDESKKFAYGDRDFYIGDSDTLCKDIKKSDLTKLRNEVITDEYSYRIEGTEYHHTGTGKESYLLGDVNNDNLIDINDATIIQKYIADYDLPNPEIIKLCANINGDSDIDISDVTLIQKHIADYELPYPIGKPIG